MAGKYFMMILMIILMVGIYHFFGFEACIAFIAGSYVLNSLMDYNP